jgi:hypothetical protein
MGVKKTGLVSLSTWLSGKFTCTKKSVLGPRKWQGVSLPPSKVLLYEEELWSTSLCTLQHTSVTNAGNCKHNATHTHTQRNTCAILRQLWHIRGPEDKWWTSNFKLQSGVFGEKKENRNKVDTLHTGVGEMEEFSIRWAVRRDGMEGERSRRHLNMLNERNIRRLRREGRGGFLFECCYTFST